MKIVTFKIPTTFKELRSMLKERTNKRYQHNAKVLMQLVNDITAEINSGYWRNDISDTMKNRVCRKFGEMYVEAKYNLK